MKNIVTTRYKFFNWVVCHLQLAANNTFKVAVSETMPVNKLDTQTLYTKGSITGVDESGNQMQPRSPGFYLRDAVSEVPAGVHTYTTQEDCEWWCIDAKLNHAQLPITQIFRLNAGQTTDLAVGTKLILCEGSLTLPSGVTNAPSAISVSNSVTQVTANANCYGYLIDRERG